MPGYNVQSWRGSISDGTVDLFYIVSLDTGAVIKVSPALLEKMYNDGLIKIMPSAIIQYLNLSTPNPYIGEAVMTLKIFIKDWNTALGISSAHVTLGGYTGGGTTADGSTIFNQIPKKIYSVIITKTGYQTLNISLDLTGEGSYSTYTFRIKPIEQTAPQPDPEKPEKAQERLTIYYKDAATFFPFLRPAGFIGGGVAKLTTAENKATLLAKINAAVPGGWEITAFSIHPDRLIIDFDEKGSPAIGIVAIIAIIVGVLAVFGLIVGWWKLEDRKGKEAATEKVIAKGDIVQELANLGFSAAEIAVILAGLDSTPPSGDMFGEIKDIVIMGVGAAIIIMLVQQMGKGTS